MGYTRRPLSDLTSTALISTGANFIVPGSGPVLAGILSLTSSISNIFGGGGRDAQRQARANFFRDAANLGSVAAARYVIGGEQNTGGNEIPYYQSAQASIQANHPDVWAEAVAEGPDWAAGIPDPGGTQSMVNKVQAELATLQQALTAPANVANAPGSPGSTIRVMTPAQATGRPAMLPGMVSTAPFNYGPYLLLGGAGLVAVLLLGQRDRRN